MRLVLTVVATALAFLGQGVYGQEYLEEIRVLGARMSRAIEDVIGRVDVINREDLVDQMTVSMADLVRYTPGVSVATADTRFGATGFTVRGLGGNRVTSLIDGVPVPDQFHVGAFSNSSQDFLTPDTISRIEILHGPASTLYGSDALGGVVAILTRDAEELLAGDNYHLGASGIYSGRNNSMTSAASVALRSGSYTAMLNLGSRTGHEVGARGAVLLDSVDRSRKNLLTKIGMDIGSGNKLVLKAETFEDHVTSELWGVLGYGRRYRNTTSLEGDDERKRDSLSLAYHFETDFDWLSRGAVVAYRQNLNVRQTTDERRELLNPAVHIQRVFNYKVRSSGMTLDLESRFFWGDVDHLIGWGVSYGDTDIREQRDGQITDLVSGLSSKVIIGETMPVRDFPLSTVKESAAYLYDEISFGNISVIPGFRVEVYDLAAHRDRIFSEDNPVSSIIDVTETSLAPKLGLLWKFHTGQSLYAQYSHGFRAPPFEDVNVGFDIPRFNYRAIPNPDLKSETSDALEVGLRMSTENIRWNVSFFSAWYRNFIESKTDLGRDENGTLLFQSRNVDKARVFGVEASIEFDLENWVSGTSISLAGNWTKGTNEVLDEPLNSVDPAELISNLTWQPNDIIRVSISNTVVLRKHRIDSTNADLFRPPGFTITDIAASFAPNRGLRIDVGIFNLANKKYWRWSSVQNRTNNDPLITQLADPGRYVSASVRIEM